MGDTKPFSSLSFCGLFRVSELGLRISAIEKLAVMQIMRGHRLTLDAGSAYIPALFRGEFWSL
jgi:hypothetical protein